VIYKTCSMPVCWDCEYWNNLS